MASSYEDINDPFPLNDHELQDLVVQELAELPELDPELLEIAVNAGFVAVSGRVGSESELELIQQVLINVVGEERSSNEVLVDNTVNNQGNDASVNAAGNTDVVGNHWPAAHHKNRSRGNPGG